MRKDIIHWRSTYQRYCLVGEICEEGCGARLFPPGDVCHECGLPIQAEGVFVSSKTGFGPIVLTDERRELVGQSWRENARIMAEQDRLYEEFREGRISWPQYLAVVWPTNRR